MATGNNFEFGGASASSDMTPEEILADRGVCVDVKYNENFSRTT